MTNRTDGIQRLADKALRFAERSGYVVGTELDRGRRLCDYEKEHGANDAAADLAGKRAASVVHPDATVAKLLKLARFSARCSREYRATREAAAGINAWNAAIEAARCAGYATTVLAAK